MAQTHLKDLYELVEYTWDYEAGEYTVNTAPAIAYLQDALSADYAAGSALLSEFARFLRGMDYLSQDDYLNMRETFIQNDPELGWVFDSGGLPLIEESWNPGHTWAPIVGTANAEAIRPAPWEVSIGLAGSWGEDVIYGSERDEIISSTGGDSVLVGGTGDDELDSLGGDDRVNGWGGDTVKFPRRIISANRSTALYNDPKRLKLSGNSIVAHG
jgi:Ca2+-binding RTX toxin-like protein